MCQSDQDHGFPIAEVWKHRSLPIPHQLFAFLVKFPALTFVHTKLLAKDYIDLNKKNIYFHILTKFRTDSTEQKILIGFCSPIVPQIAKTNIGHRHCIYKNDIWSRRDQLKWFNRTHGSNYSRRKHNTALYLWIDITIFINIASELKSHKLILSHSAQSLRSDNAVCLCTAMQVYCTLNWRALCTDSRIVTSF